MFASEQQIYPFPFEALVSDLKRFVNAELIWCQEEPKNMGPWNFMMEKMQSVFGALGRNREMLKYVGRVESASPATGLMSKHVKEQETLVGEALSLGPGKERSQRKKSQKKNKAGN